MRLYGRCRACREYVVQSAPMYTFSYMLVDGGDEMMWIVRRKGCVICCQKLLH